MSQTKAQLLDGKSAAIQFTSGSASAPSVSFTGDTNTGIYSPGADQVAISTNGSGRLFVDASGNVGVGTNDTANAFVTLTNQDVSLRLNPVTGSASITAVQTGVAFRDLTIGSNETIFQTAATERLRITSAGLVGVRTSSPSALLSVASTTTSYTAESFNIGEPSLSTGRQLYMGYNTADGVGFIQPVHWGTEFKPLVLCPNGGRVGIGTTAPSYALDVRTTGTSISSLFTSDQSEQYIALKDSGTTIGHVRLGSTSGSMLFFAGNGERGRFDSSGRLLVGTSTSVTGVNQPQYAKLQVIGNTLSGARAGLIALGRSEGASTIVEGEQLGGITFGDNAAGEFAYIFGEADGTAGANDYPGRLVFSTTADGASSPTERMRITNGGLIDIGGPYSVGANAIRFDVQGSNFSRNTTSSATQIVFVNPNGTVGTITTSGSATAYNTSSDYRLKENVSAVTDGITRLQQLKPSRFNFIADPTKTVDGFIAHEVQTVVPEAISGEKDAVDADGKPIYQGIDQSKLVPLLTAALQEAITKIESLEARLTGAGI